MIKAKRKHAHSVKASTGPPVPGKPPRTPNPPMRLGELVHPEGGPSYMGQNAKVKANKKKRNKGRGN